MPAFTSITAETTVEELEIELGDGYWADWCEVEVEIDVQPEEKQTHEYPGCPASAEITNLVVKKVYVTDDHGDEATWNQEHACKLVNTALEDRGWANDQDDWALDTVSEREQGLADEYWNHKIDLARGK